MFDNNALNQIAYAMVEEQTNNYLNGDKMGYFLMLNGVMRFKLEARPGAGHNFRIILDQIYEYYKKHPDIQMGDILYEAILQNISLLFDFEKANLNLNYIAEQINNEASGKSPFKIDNMGLLNALKQRCLLEETLKNHPGTEAFIKSIDTHIQTHG